MTELRVDSVDPNPFQTRMEFDEEKICELAESIGKVGLLQRVLVRPHPEVEGRYQLGHGERRLKAFKHLGRSTIPANVRELSDREMVETVVIENLQREDLNPLEEAQGYRNIVDRFNTSKAEVGRMVGKSRAYISNSMRLLEMPFFLRACVLCKTLTPWHARVIMGLPEGYAKYVMADLVMDWELSVSETRKCVNDVKAGRARLKWTRNVRVDGLREDEAFRGLLHRRSSAGSTSLMGSMRRHGQLVPIAVYVNGSIINGHRRVVCARELGWSELRAEVVYLSRWMEGRGGAPWPFVVQKPRVAEAQLLGIVPEISEEERRNIAKLVAMLRSSLQEQEGEL